MSLPFDAIYDGVYVALSKHERYGELSPSKMRNLAMNISSNVQANLAGTKPGPETAPVDECGGSSPKSCEKAAPEDLIERAMKITKETEIQLCRLFPGAEVNIEFVDDTCSDHPMKQLYEAMLRLQPLKG